MRRRYGTYHGVAVHQRVIHEEEELQQQRAQHHPHPSIRVPVPYARPEEAAEAVEEADHLPVLLHLLVIVCGRYACVCMGVRAYMYMYMHLTTCWCVCVRVGTYMYVSMRVYVYVSIYIYMGRCVHAEEGSYLGVP